MKLVPFAEINTIIAKDQPEYLAMAAHRFGGPQGRICCCWLLNWRERLQKPLQPQLLTAQKPVFGEEGA